MPILDRLVDEQKSQVNIMLSLIHACMYNCITLQLVGIVISPEFEKHQFQKYMSCLQIT